MTIRQPHYTIEEHARRGEEMYEQKIRAAVEAGNDGRIVAIDVDSGAYEIADTMLEACDRLLLAYPDAQIWCVRIGRGPVHRFGSIPRLERV
jgi:hypothetical protein